MLNTVQTAWSPSAWDMVARLGAVDGSAAHPHFARIDQIEPGTAGDVAALAKKGGKTDKSAFASPVKDFYLTNPIARASAVMAECSSLARNGFAQAAE